MYIDDIASGLRRFASRCLLVLTLLIVVSPAIASEDIFMVFDRDSAPNPKRLRTTSDPYLEDRVKLLNDREIPIPSREGLDALNLIGCGQFNVKDIEALHQKNQKTLHVVDLREESHGFIDGVPISWFAQKNSMNKGLKTEEIIEKEKAMLEGLKGLGTIGAHSIIEKGEGVIADVAETVIKKPSLIQTEPELMQSMNIQYHRAPVTDLNAPEPTIIEQYIHEMQTIPKGAQTLLHCRAGAGRTTSFMVLWDIYNNADKLAFDEIILRQYLIGGIDIVDALNGPMYKRAEALKRYEVLADFYAKTLAEKITQSILRDQASKIAKNRRRAESSVPATSPDTPHILARKKSFFATTH